MTAPRMQKTGWRSLLVGLGLVKAEEPAIAVPPHPAVAENLFHGRLIVSQEAPWSGRVFYIDKLRHQRHWVTSGEHLAAHGFSLKDVIQVTPGELAQFNLGGQLPMKWDREAWRNPPRTSPTEMREIMISQLRGRGIEFGGETGPLPAPLSCEVYFADYVPEEEVRARKSEGEGKEFVVPDFVTSFDNPTAIPDASQDFVFACHVIEHIRSPFRAFEAAYRILKPGGHLALVIPDKERTFDRNRDLTTLEHLILDYTHPDPDRDKDHFREYFQKAQHLTPDRAEMAMEMELARGGDTHFHTWTYESFGAMVDYIRRNVSPWEVVWRQPAIDGHPESVEFYYLLRKPA